MRFVMPPAVIAALAMLSIPGSASAVTTSVTLTGSLQNEVGCAADFDPSCAASMLLYDTGDDIWQRAFALPAGSYQYFVALNGSFAETYGLNGGNSLSPISLDLAAGTTVKFYFDDKSNWLTDNFNTDIAVLAGSFQSELGCAGDFDPGCLRSWLQDLDGDGIFTFSALLPAGDYSTIVAINESFDERYGLGGAFGGANIEFTAGSLPVLFSYDSATHILSIDNGLIPAVPEPATWAMMLLGFGGIGMALRRGRKQDRLLSIA